MRYFKLILYYVISLSFLILSSCFFISTSEFQFLDRVEVGINGVITYVDYIKITNYQDNSLTAKEMYKFAEQYVDTVQADKIIEAVTFVSEKPFNSLPEDVFEDYSGKIKKNSLLEFSFISAVSNNTPSNQKFQLYTATIWKNGDHETYYCRFPKDKTVIDSLLGSKQPFNNF